MGSEAGSENDRLPHGGSFDSESALAEDDKTEAMAMHVDHEKANATDVSPLFQPLEHVWVTSDALYEKGGLLHKLEMCVLLLRRSPFDKKQLVAVT